MITPWKTEAPLRNDHPKQRAVLTDILKNAPCALDGCFAIPKFVAQLFLQKRIRYEYKPRREY